MRWPSFIPDPRRAPWAVWRFYFENLFWAPYPLAVVALTFMSFGYPKVWWLSLTLPFIMGFCLSWVAGWAMQGLLLSKAMFTMHKVLANQEEHISALYARIEELENGSGKSSDAH